MSPIVGAIVVFTCCAVAAVFDLECDPDIQLSELSKP
jgi:hypothetical protein